MSEGIQKYEDLFQLRIMSNTINAVADGVKIDCIAYRYNHPAPVETIQNLRLYSLKDIAAMKLSEVGGRGNRKDFYDIAALLSVMSLSEMIDCFVRKYPNADTFHTIRALTYFEDANQKDEIILSETSPLILKSWQSVKLIILKQIKQYKKGNHNRLPFFLI
ncbi:MAG: nucleotidyl transferase AbiEii/AbiGii toxin family protein [Ignavibacteriae bacterium]|nr:nucleotidyl transferase AbiEii/AbiGii toxin family protein [Ignavibacteriota bacterium]